MDKEIAVRDVRKFFSAQDDIETMRIYYCYQIGSTFVNLNLMESTIVDAMAMCNRIKLSKVLQDDAPAWRNIVERYSQLQTSTLGHLVAILSRHGIDKADLGYLQWVRDKRNFFVHHLFQNGYWPGDLAEPAICVLCRRLLYLEHIFRRAGNRIWKIFGRAGLLEYHDLGKDGAMLMNVGALANEEESWLTDFAIAAIRHRAQEQRSRKEQARRRRNRRHARAARKAASQKRSSADR